MHLVRCLAHLVVLSSALLAAAASAHASTPDDGRCWADWSQAGSVVQKEELRSAKDVRVLAQSRRAGQLLTITLCKEQGKFVYRLVFLGQAGRVENLSVDARRPFEP